MRTDESTPLAQAFVEDHQHLTRGLSGILEAVRAGDLPTAAALAQEMDCAVGPHMEFEEEVLYPQVAGNRGRPFVEQLYEEHRLGQEAVRTLLHAAFSSPLSPGEREDLVAKLETAFDHVLSCGTLLSHLTVLDAAQQETMLRQLRAYQSRGRRWSELPPAVVPDGN